ncbi:histidine kinase [Pontiella sulfatireligans]|uniref:histidine kinase n=1 Tax=Pontiella sulfatireligans TaxID=2750658 RepID=UPI001443B1D0|nr:histidine kinase [Pontiella sulfatireligans]
MKNRSLSGLEQRLLEIDTHLSQLANYGLGTGIGAIGYRSTAHETDNHSEWIEIDFGKIVPLNEVMLVPAIRRDTGSRFQADGFPLHFRLVAGTDEEREGQVVAEYTDMDKVLPRIAPFAIPCGGILASWIRIEAEQLSLRAFDDLYVFQLSEILAFSSEANVALHKPAKASSNMNIENPGWDARYVVDGFMPYLMDAAEGNQSVAYLSPPDIDPTPSLMIDLGQSFPLSRVHLHVVDQSDTLPQAFLGDFGIPKHMRIEGANSSDFSDAKPLLDLRPETIYDMGPIMMLAFPETTVRYLRFKVLEPTPTALYGGIAPRMGFAEIEVFSKGRNIALNKPVSTSFKLSAPDRPLSNLTDGLNIYGSILPIREWLTQLATRHEFEAERPRISEELNQRYTRQKKNLTRMSWLAVLLASGTIITMLVDRIIRQRAIYRTRERIAADLHDELGANIHAIGLLGDLAQAAKNSPEKIDKLLQRMRALTERTGAAARHCTNLLEAQGLYEDLVEDMRRTSARIMADLDHTISFDGEEVLKRLKPRKRIDLFLFYKECLINVLRHSGATRVTTQLTANSKELDLTITDNGHGLIGEIPSSLKRRARLLGAQMSSEKSETGGTRICLSLKLKKFGV